MKVENARLDTTFYTLNTDDTLVLTEFIAVLLEYLILIVCNSVGLAYLRHHFSGVSVYHSGGPGAGRLPSPSVRTPDGRPGMNVF